MTPEGTGNGANEAEKSTLHVRRVRFGARRWRAWIGLPETQLSIRDRMISLESPTRIAIERSLQNIFQRDAI